MMTTSYWHLENEIYIYIYIISYLSENLILIKEVNKILTQHLYL